jgi:hypothetical protein
MSHILTQLFWIIDCPGQVAGAAWNLECISAFKNHSNPFDDPSAVTSGNTNTGCGEF